MTGLIMPWAAGMLGGATPWEITFEDSQSSNSVLTTFNFTSMSLGTPSANRDIIVVVQGGREGSRTVNSCSVAGNSATLLARSPSSSDNFYPIAIYRIADSVNSSGTISVTFSGSMRSANVAVYASNRPVAIGNTDLDDNNGFLGSSTDFSLNISAGSYLICGQAHRYNSAVTWSGATEVYENQESYATYSGTLDLFETAQTPQVVSAAHSSQYLGGMAYEIQEA